jgi:NAD(P)-dependent dehydrogenase (short-subunit alcohol dehydrogenase family)
VVQSTVSVSTAGTGVDNNGAKSHPLSSTEMAQQPANSISTNMTKSSNQSESTNSQLSTNQAKGQPIKSTPSSHATPAAQQPVAALHPGAMNPLQAFDITSSKDIPGRNVDQVMIHFHETMLKMTDHFLETQQKVMQAYLQGQQMQAGRTLGLASLAKAEPSNGKSSNLELERPGFTLDSLSNQSVQFEVQQAINLQSNFGVSSQVDGAKQANHEKNSAAVQLTVSEPIKQEESESDSEYLINSLLEIVSERTGYPTEMLDPNLDLEADLGIDSIKRVEILNSFRRILPEAKQKQLEAGIEDLAGTKTLQGIIDWLRSDVKHENNGKSSLEAVDSNNGNGKHVSAKATPNGKNGSHPEQVQEKEQIAGARIRRGVVTLVPLEPPVAVLDKEASIVSNKLAIITEDRLGLAAALASQLKGLGFVPITLRHDLAAAPMPVSSEQSSYSLNLTDPAAVNETLNKLTTKFGQTRSLFHLQAFGSKLDLASSDQDAASADSVVTLFLLAKYLGTHLSTSSKEPGCGIIAATSMGGTFGAGNAPALDFSPMQAGIAGLIKSTAKEFKDLTCKVVDFNPEPKNKDKALLAKQLIAELMSRDESVEVGYLKEKRFGLAVQAKPLSAEVSRTPKALTSQSVVFVTGGARGITAEIALELAIRYQPKMVILGRSQRPSSNEDSRFAALTSAREIKGAIIEQFKAEGKPVSIPAVEERYQALMHQREVRNNLAKIEAAGSKLEYRQVDVRDAQALTQAIKDTYASYGEINAVIHGAGVIEDSYLKDKSLESFKNVFETKVLSALTLINKLQLSSLDYLVFFSSVVARTGNAGQADYVAANEVLNKLALLSQKNVRGRSISLMWGPWKAGMAQPELESIFAAHGWAMIDIVGGRQVFVDELLNSNKSETEVLLVAELDKQTAVKLTGPKLSQANVLRNSSGDLEFLFDLNADKDRFLADHAFDGVPVMPMAFALEFMSEAVLAVYPDWKLLSIESLDIPSGIVFDTTTKSISITVHEESRTETQVMTSVSLSSGTTTRRTCFKAGFQLARSLTESATEGKVAAQFLQEEKSPDIGEAAIVPPLSDIYGSWLFHGPLFQGIRQIRGVGAHGVLGLIRTSNPSDCLTGSEAGDWVIDPVMLDSAMQLAGIWARQFLDITVLPTGFRRLTRLASPTGRELSVRIFVSPESGATELTCDLAIYNSNGQLILLIEGLGGVGSKSLNRLSGGGLSVGAKR